MGATTIWATFSPKKTNGASGPHRSIQALRVAVSAPIWEKGRHNRAKTRIKPRAANQGSQVKALILEMSNFKKLSFVSGH
jgi:hypothetical protein